MQAYLAPHSWLQREVMMNGTEGCVMTDIGTETHA